MEEKYEALRLRNQLCYPIYLCAKELTRRYGPVLKPLDLTYTQYVVMMYFWEMKQSNVTELGNALLLDSGTLTPLLKKLEAKGYLSRTRSAADERNLIVTLTPAGEALREEALCVPAQIGSCLRLTPQEAADLYRLTNKLLANMEQGEQEHEESNG